MSPCHGLPEFLSIPRGIPKDVKKYKLVANANPLSVHTIIQYVIPSSTGADVVRK